MKLIREEIESVEFIVESKGGKKQLSLVLKALNNHFLLETVLLSKQIMQIVTGQRLSVTLVLIALIQPQILAVLLALK